MSRRTDLLVILAISCLAGCGAPRAHVAEAIDQHAAAAGSLELADRHVAEARAAHDAVAIKQAQAERDQALAKQKAADDALVHQREQVAIDAQAAVQAGDYRSSRIGIVASLVLVALSFRFPAISGLLLTLATVTGAAAYGFAAAGWLRGHLWLIPVSGGGIGIFALVHHLLGKDHVNRLGPAVDGGKATISRWLPSGATIRAHWHLPPWLTGIGALFHRAPPAPPRTTP